MKISLELAEKIVEFAPQIQHKFDISIGFSNPVCSVLDEGNDFVIYQDGEVFPDSKHIEYGEVYIVEFNPFQYEVEGIFVSYTPDLEQITERIKDFLIDFHCWVKNGKIKSYTWEKYKHWEWKPDGVGRYHVKRNEEHSYIVYCCSLENFEREDLELRRHIEKVFCTKVN